MRLLVVGAGSTGGYIGGRLAQAGCDVTFLVRQGRAAQLRRAGLHIESPRGSAILWPKIVIAGAIEAPFDAVILATKAFQLETVLTDIEPAIGPKTMILPVLNGMLHLDLISERFSRSNLVGCALKVATMLKDDGGIVQLTPMQDLAFGELDGSRSTRIMDLDAVLKMADIGARISETIYREMWEKWILLATLGAATCLMRGNIGEIEACAEGVTFVQRLLEEVVTIVRAVGEAPSDAFINSTREQLTAKGSPLTSSMFRDLNRGWPIEVDAIIGDLLRRGHNAGLTSPLLAAAYTHLLVYQHRVEALR